MKQSLYIELRKNNKLEEIAFEYYKEKGGKADFLTIVNSGFLSFINYDSFKLLNDYLLIFYTI